MHLAGTRYWRPCANAWRNGNQLARSPPRSKGRDSVKAVLVRFLVWMATGLVGVVAWGLIGFGVCQVVGCL